MKRSKILGRIVWFIFRQTPLTLVLQRFWPPRAYVKIEYAGKILLVQNWLGSGKWAFPGGGVHRGEDPKDGACREVFEELGITLQPSDLKYVGEGLVKYLFGGKKFTIYETVLDEKPSIRLNPELNGLVWVEKSDIKNHRIEREVLDSL